MFYLDPLVSTSIRIPEEFPTRQHIATMLPYEQERTTEIKKQTPPPPKKKNPRPDLSTYNCSLPKPRCLDDSVKPESITARTIRHH